MRWGIASVVILGLAAFGAACGGGPRAQAEQTQGEGKDVVERSTSEGKDVVERFSFAGTDRTYLLHVPPGIEEEKPVPLLVMLHYYTGTGVAEMYQTGFSDKADAEGFLVVYPDGPNFVAPGFAWATPSENPGPNPDAAFVAEVIKRLQVQYAIDPKRIYVCGMSQGAMAAHAIGCELSSVVAAIAPVNGMLLTKPTSPDPISVLIVNGTDDTSIPYEGAPASPRTGGRPVPSVAEAVAAWVAHNGCKPEPAKTVRENLTIETYSGGRGGTEVVLYTRVGGGHEWPGDHTDKTTTNHVDADDLWAFFASHPKE